MTDRPKKRKLTPAEVAFLRRAWPEPLSWWGRETRQTFLLFQLFGLPIGFVFSAVFFLLFRYANHLSFDEALRMGLMGFLVGPGFGLVLSVWMLVSQNSAREHRSIKHELKQGECDLHYFSLRRAWRVLDTGDAEHPWMLAETSKGRFFWFSDGDLENAGTPAGEFALAKLPKSKTAVGMQFLAGQPLVISGSDISIEGLLKYAGAPTLEPLGFDDLLDEAKALVQQG